jgi:hypothetical protein
VLSDTTPAIVSVRLAFPRNTLWEYTATPQMAGRITGQYAPHGKLPERSAGSAYGTGFGATANRNSAQLERERQERAQREAQSHAAAGSPMASLTDEQREEINEAVRPLSSL